MHRTALAVLAALTSVAGAEPQKPVPTAITNARVVVSADKTLAKATVVLRDGRLADVLEGDAKVPPDALVIDGSGLVLAPSFIDMHTHSDRTLLVDPAAQSKIRQGVTTELIGNCGSSPTPFVGVVAEEEGARFRRWGVEPTWRTMGEYLDTLADRGVGLNVAALVGHGAVRKATMGYAMRAPDAAELAQIRRYVAEGGFVFAMCTATETLELALGAFNVYIAAPFSDGTPVDPDASRKMKWDRTMAFQNAEVQTNPGVNAFSDIDGHQVNTSWKQPLGSFTLFEP